MKWYSFGDMHSGGTRKSKHDMYLIEAESEFSAVTVFRNETGRDPNHVTCECCGEDYSIIEWNSKEQLMESMAYERDMKIIEHRKAQLTEVESELLRVAEMTRDFIENIEMNDLLTEHEQILLDRARSAIAKARGESR